MTIKDQIVEIMRLEGYDFVTASESVNELLRDLARKRPGEYRYFVGSHSFTLRKESD
ncbi:MAG: hypothetical protein KGI27_13370 [Thaumarchaeota archaeon]|nr:hypothetical protein [Nitrososphaerota archaeon]